MVTLLVRSLIFISELLLRCLLIGSLDLILKVSILLIQHMKLVSKIIDVLPLNTEILLLELAVLETFPLSYLILSHLCYYILLLTCASLLLLRVLVLDLCKFCYRKRIRNYRANLQSWLRSLLLRVVTSFLSSAIWLISSMFSFIMLLLSSLWI